MDELLKPSTLDGGVAAAEMRMRVATMLCKTFLQYHVVMVGVEVGDVFGHVLERLERFGRGERDALVSLCGF